VKYWAQAAEEFPGVPEGDLLRKTIHESSEPVVGCLGVVVQAHSDGIPYKPQSGEVGMCLRVGRMGSDKCRWTGTLKPGPERGPLG